MVNISKKEAKHLQNTSSGSVQVVGGKALEQDPEISRVSASRALEQDLLVAEECL